MDDVSKIVGKTMLTFNGKDYLLDNFGFDDWSVIQSALVREKRRRFVEVAVDTGMDAEEARRQSIAISSLGEKEAEEIIGSDQGLALVLWAMIERRYPGQVTRKDVYEQLRKGKINPDELPAIFEAIKLAMGDDPAGN